MDHEFDSIGRKLIIATKDGYGPGLAKLAVKKNIVDKMKIRAPKCSIVNESVAMGVVDKRTGEPVPRADMWAIPIPGTGSDDVESSIDANVRDMLDDIRNANEEDVESVLRGYGWYIGQTGEDGTIDHVFSDTGRYLLVSVKEGYVPAFKWIRIYEDYSLNIESPKIAGVNEDVTFTVKIRCLDTPIEGVDLYGINLNDVTDSTIRSGNLKDMESKANELAEMATDNGFYIGTTNSDGQCTYQFSDKGRYLVIGIEEGYRPTITYISIGEFSKLRDRISSLKRLIPEDGNIEGITPRIKQFRQGLENIFPQMNGLKRVQPQAGGVHELIPDFEMSLDVY